MNLLFNKPKMIPTFESFASSNNNSMKTGRYNKKESHNNKGRNFRNGNSGNSGNSSKLLDPHQKSFYNYGHNKAKQIPHISISSISLKYKNTYPRIKYKTTGNDKFSLVHWGQRKLLMSEIDFFLNAPSKKDCVCIYAGAAPANHTKYLSSLFPNIYFVLYDPNNFNIEADSRIEIHQEYFTMDTITAMQKRCESEWENKTILFISDIRTCAPNMTNEEIDKCVCQDMSMQEEWVRALKPDISLLKFRLPWDNSETTYLNGDIRVQIWAPIRSTETRLLVTDPDSHNTYNNQCYEEQMFYYNSVKRFSHVDYPADKYNVPGIDHCLDCALEVKLLGEYLLHTGHINALDFADENVISQISTMMNEITKEISHGRNLETVITKTAKKEWSFNKSP